MSTAMTRISLPNELFRDRFSRFFDQVWDESARGLAATTPENTSGRAWRPAVDIKETADFVSLAVELPGLTKEDVEVSIENQTLTLSGERKFEKDVKEESYHRVERSYGRFSRSFTLPRDVRSEEIEARFQNGLLEITLPKVEEAKARRIDIQ
ncbi:MAG: Hsp20/alpha crystallin family protein [Acidobacteriota bacterium]